MSDTRLTEVASFIDHLVHERRLSRHTALAYRRDIDSLLALFPAQSLDQFDTDLIRSAIARLHSRGLAPRSLARALSAWRALFDWRCRSQPELPNPCAGLRPPKRGRSLPKALSPDHAAALFAGEGESLLELRDLALAELLYSAGLRLAELCQLDVEAGGHMLRDGEVSVLGKGGKRRSVPVGSKARAALALWLDRRDKLADTGETALFVSERGTRLSARSVQARLARWAQVSGIGVHVHPHVLRHSFATHVLQSSGDLRAVQEMLGHASIATTQIYTALDFQHLARVYDQAHPRARRKSGS